VRVGIAGYGLAGRVFHAPLVAATDGLDVAVVVTSSPDRAAQVAADHPGAQVVTDVAAALGRIDLLVVATPNDVHVPLATAAVDAGVPVVVDKPLAATSADAAALVDHAAQRGVGLTVFHNRRWDGDFLTLRQLLAAGRLGAVHRFESRFERWRPQPRNGSWREDPDPALAGGTLFDLGPHLVDQALVCFGPVTSVYAEIDRRRRGAAVDDDVFVALTHTSGVRSHLWAGALVALAGPRLRVLGDAGGFACWGMDPQEAQLGDGLRPGDPGFGADPDRRATVGVGDGEPVAVLAGAYRDFYTGVAAALRSGAPMPVDPEDGVAVVRVLEAARRSAATGSVVTPGA
jgi:scyllo-inositol 2-dehydrogenase (NADP+)